ncbi:MAG: hypothetical protein Q8S56_09420 [Polaromonas sp.]|nr:hypothetical protein [Polaromonas sp.]
MPTEPVAPKMLIRRAVWAWARRGCAMADSGCRMVLVTVLVMILGSA